MLNPEEMQALVLSIKVSLLSVVISLIPALFCAKVLSGRNFRGKTVLDAVIHLPLVIPPVVTGYFLLVYLGRKSAVGGFLDSIGISLAFNWKGAAVAAAVISFPLIVRSMRLSIESIDSGLYDAAKTLGAGKFRIFMSVTLPLALPGIISGCVLGFARSLGEFGATITFVSNIPGETETLPLAIYSLTQTPGGEAMAARLCLISVMIALSALAVSEVISRKTSKRLGR